jgi:hypothetical protein
MIVQRVALFHSISRTRHHLAPRSFGSFFSAALDHHSSDPHTLTLSQSAHNNRYQLGIMFDTREGALTQLYLATSPEVESKNIKG